MQRGRRRSLLFLLSLLAALAAPWALQETRGQSPSTPHGALAALQLQDLRLARLADVMLVANHTLCRAHMPVTGILIHSMDQYARPDAHQFAQAQVAIALVVPGSPAERAGLRAGDGLAAIGGTPVADLRAEVGPLRDAVFDLLAIQPPAAPLGLAILRDGSEIAVTVEPQAGCRALVEVLSDSGRIARSDGRVIQLSYGLMSAMSDDALAATFAHELAHLALEHRRRLSEAGVRKGFLGEIGGNRRRNRQVEVEADRMSVHLLANAGLDPAVAPRFWLSSEGRRVDAGIFRSAIYPSPIRRAQLIQAEIDEFLPLGRGPSTAGHLLALRDEPL